MKDFRGVWGEIKDDDSKKDAKSEGFKSDEDEFPDMLDEDEIEKTLN